jgi:hypothetical protein
LKMITQYTESLRLKEERLRLIEIGVFEVSPDKLEELQGEVLLLRRLETEEVKDGIDELIDDITLG